MSTYHSDAPQVSLVTKNLPDLDVLHPTILVIIHMSITQVTHDGSKAQGLKPQPPAAALESSEKALKYNSNFPWSQS